MERLPQRDDIQGLRAIAVLAVILFHVDRKWLPGGFTGVDIFLVISGFLITSIILRQQQEGSFSYLSFYVSRIRRIVPAYLALLAVVTFCVAILLTPKDYVTYEKSLRAALYFGSNYFFANQSDYFAPAAPELPLLHTWSLAVEMQFYLLLPVLLRLIPRRFSGPFLTVVVVTLVAQSSYRLALGERQAEYFSMISRIPEFLIGSLIAIFPAWRHWSGRGCNLAASSRAPVDHRWVLVHYRRDAVSGTALACSMPRIGLGDRSWKPERGQPVAHELTCRFDWRPVLLPVSVALADSRGNPLLS